MKRCLLTILALFVLISSYAQKSSKYEFRGVWVQTVFQMQYQTMNKQRMQDYFINMLDTFQQLGFNALIFQVRPEADAFYNSEIEPWSRFFTGVQGMPPAEDWDPMEFLIEECHKRGMEFHAWLNPYRVTASLNQPLSPNHIYFKHPEWFVSYGGKIYFDPGLPQSRRHFCTVIKDIVSRYDVDAIHMDDYFYPYPVNGEKFPDDETFAIYGPRQGFATTQKEDWRRYNTDMLVSQIKQTIRQVKPWVRFGVSPFGIYRNKKSTPDGSGSETNGLQNYDDLYADILKWDREGWIDYNMPQIYWEIGHTAADYKTLIEWWNSNTTQAHLYVGQDVNRSVRAPEQSSPNKNQMDTKIDMARRLSKVSGSCFWYGTDILADNGGIKSQLNKLHGQVAMVPPYPNLYNLRPREVKGLKAKWTPNGYVLMWKEYKEKNPMDQHVAWAVYRFDKGERVDLNNSSALVGVTRDPFLKLPYNDGKKKYTYVVTSINRTNIESLKGKKKSVKL